MSHRIIGTESVASIYETPHNRELSFWCAGSFSLGLKMYLARRMKLKKLFLLKISIINLFRSFESWCSENCARYGKMRTLCGIVAFFIKTYLH